MLNAEPSHILFLVQSVILGEKPKT